MKKHQLVAFVGTLALAANLLLPNLSFAQQTGTVNVGCPTTAGPTNNVTLSRIPQTVTFTSVQSPLTGTASTFDNSTVGNTDLSVTPLAGGNLNAVAPVGTGTGLINDTPAADDHLIGVKDVSSQGVDGCGGQNGWSVSATITTLNGGGAKALTGPANGDSILASSMHLVTTTNVATTNISNNLAGNGFPAASATHVIYNDYTTTGNTHKASGLSFMAGTNPGLENSYVSGTNTLENAAVPVLNHSCASLPAGENTDVYTGVVIDIDHGIHALQTNGFYSGTIQYTFSQTTNCG